LYYGLARYESLLLRATFLFHFLILKHQQQLHVQLETRQNKTNRRKNVGLKMQDQIAEVENAGLKNAESKLSGGSVV